MRISVLTIGLCLFVACKQPTYSPAQYIKYVQNEENGLAKKIEVDGWEYEMQYRPYDYTFLTESQGKLSDSFKRARLRQLQGTAWFYIKFKKTNSSASPLRIDVASLEEYQDRYAYYTSKAIADIALIYDKDTIRPMSYVFETSYNVSPYEAMLVGFELRHGTQQPERNMQLIFFDRIFRNGIIKATFKKEMLDNLKNIKVSI